MKWIVVVVFALLPASAVAQTHLEVRGGATIGSISSSRAGLEIEPGASFDVLVERNIWGLLTAYGSYGRLSYGCTQVFCKGVSGGYPVTANHGVLGVGARWRFLWVRTGMMVGMASIRDEREHQIGIGAQGAFGVMIEVGPIGILSGLSLERMQLKYVNSSSDWATAMTHDLGVRYRLP